LQVSDAITPKKLFHILVFWDGCYIQLGELEKATSVAERNPARFGVDFHEILQRKRWMNNTREAVMT
jgi:hypothetical protein